MASFGNITHGPKSIITSKFGNRIHPKTKKYSNHKGIDIRADIGTDILAMADGVVTDSAIRNNFCGGTLKIDHGIIDGKKIETRFCHLSNIPKKVGDKVKQGEVVAKSGQSGRVTGPHIHFEVIVDGQHVNPEPYYNGSVTYQKKSDIENEDLPIPDEDETTDTGSEPEKEFSFGKLDPIISGIKDAFGKISGIKPVVKEEIDRIKELMK